MARLALAAGAVAVVALVVVLMIEAQPDEPAEVAVSPAEATEATAQAQPSSPTPRRMRAEPAPEISDASPLPTPAEVQEAKARVMAEHDKNPNRAPYILDNNFKAKPMRDARKAFSRGDYPTALQRAEDALAVEPDANSARVMAVLAACGMGEGAIAQAHADKLDDMRKSRVARRCEKLGVQLKGLVDVDPDQ